MTTDKKTNTQSRKPSNSSKSSKSAPKLRMLIDASQTEETRVAVVQKNRLEDFEVESLLRKQIKGNIYLAKVTRVEPSLQAAFVNYGGNRHGFLPFSEIHPDYYRIPVADRERLMAEQEELERAAAEAAAREEEEEDRKAAEEEENATAISSDDDDNVVEIEDDEKIIEAGAEAEQEDDESDEEDEDDTTDEASADDETSENEETDTENTDGEQKPRRDDRRGRGRYRNRRGRNGRRHSAARKSSDSVSEDIDDDVSDVEPFWKRIRRAYKIQEVIKRGQIMLIQVGKEERGNKGAAVTTYITMPGRYCVLMPNTPQSGGVSRKISNFKDRKRMREILKDLDVPQGMSVILRTAGTSRTKAEIKRDLDYLMRLWNNARSLTLESVAPALIHEEGSLIRRAIRDLYTKDIDEVLVAGEEGFKNARDMMKMLMPSHAKKVVHYTNETPMFIAEKLEKQIEDMHSPQVELPSGGYLVINPTEALVSIDVNSGRSTKERNIEDTALRTNLEAAAEIARQLRLRDLGGLVVIDFIDMDNRRYNGKVEKAMRDALSTDRARIQIGRISSFGLMEMSRQRLHPSLTEAHFEQCPHCHGMGIVKTVDTMALTILRAIEETGLKQSNIIVTVSMPAEVALYLFNHHRKGITDLENRYDLMIRIETAVIDDPRGFTIETAAKQTSQDSDEGEEERVEDNQTQPERKRHDNRRNNKGRDNQKPASDEKQPAPSDEKAESKAESKEDTDTAEDSSKDDKKPKRRSRSRGKKKIDIVETSDEVTDIPAQQEETKTKSEEKPNKVEAAAKSEEETVIAPTNDNGSKSSKKKNEEPTPEKAPEIINEAPKEKKKGWWNKLT